MSIQISFENDNAPVTRRQLVQVIAALYTDTTNSPQGFLSADATGVAQPSELLPQIIAMLSGAVD